jgi:transposase
MKLHANARTCPHSRRLAVDRVEREGWTLRAAAAGVSVRTMSKWLRRYRDEGEQGLLDRCSAPASVPSRTSDERVAMIAALRRLRMTGAEIAETLAMPLSTVSGILTRIGLGKLWRLEPLQAANRYEKQRPGELVHVECQEARQDRASGAPRHRSGLWRRRPPARLRPRVRVRPCLRRRRNATRLRRGARGREGRHIGRLPAPRGCALRCLRHPSRAADDRQRLRLPRHNPCARLQSARNQAPPHPALPAAHQRESRTPHPHPARRLGPRRDLPQQRRTTPRTQRLARLLQSTPTTP